MSYNPTKKPSDIDYNIEEISHKDVDGKKTVYVEVSVKKTLKERFETYINKLKNLDDHFWKMLSYGLWLNVAYIAQGFVGLITLTYKQPNLTHKPSLKLSRQMAIAKKERREKQEAEENAQRQREKGEEVIVQPQNDLSKDEEMELWMRKMRGEEC